MVKTIAFVSTARNEWQEPPHEPDWVRTQPKAIKSNVVGLKGPIERLRLSINKMKRKGYAPGWQLRCPKCGAVWDEVESGIIRIKATSWRKTVLLRCVKCGLLRFLILEKWKDMGTLAQTK